MFFFLSKILNFLISPYIYILVFLLFSLFKKKKKTKKRFLLIAIIVFYLFSNEFIVDEFFRKWEKQPVSYQNFTKNYDYAIVLGGMSSYDAKNKRLNFRESVDRILYTIELYNNKKVNKIFITSGSGSIINQDVKEAIYLKEFFTKIGFPKRDLIIETESRNTHENAINTKKILRDTLNSNFLLVTSAFHMRRAIACFKKSGIKTDIFPVDNLVGERKFEIEHLFIPRIEAIQKWNLLIHEIAGFITYKFAGYI